MSMIQAVEARRDAVLAEMRSMRSLRRGSVHEQFLKVRHRGAKEPVVRGPYYLWTYSEGGKTFSQRVAAGPDLERAREDVAQHKRFVALCQEFERLTEQLGHLERERGEAPEKKRRQSRSNKTGK